MELEEIKMRLDLLRGMFLRGGEFDAHRAAEVLSAAREYLDDVEADPPIDVDDGFAILSMPRYEALRQAEEHLQETRFAPTPEDGRDGRGPTAGEPQFHPVLDKHLQDLQAEIEGIKDRLDEGCGEFNKIKARLGEVENLVGSTNVATPNLRDRLNALGARLNRIEARDGLNPILRDEDREQEEAIKSRLLQEVNSARKTDPS